MASQIVLLIYAKKLFTLTIMRQFKTYEFSKNIFKVIQIILNFLL